MAQKIALLCFAAVTLVANSAFVDEQWTEDALHFMVVGDFGQFSLIPDWMKVNKLPISLPNQLVAKKMDLLASKGPSVDFIIGAGDNFYDNPDGLTDITDERIGFMFNDVFNGKNIQAPWYMVVGNHDCRGDVDIEVQLTQEDNPWNMPSLYYEKVFDLPNGKKAVFLFLDACTLTCNNGDPEGCNQYKYKATPETASAQLQFVDSTLAKYENDDSVAWRAAVIHFPMFSIGSSHGDTEDLKTLLLPFLAKYKVDVVISGHDHNTQYTQMKWDYYNQHGVTVQDKSSDNCTRLAVGEYNTKKEMNFNQGDHLHQFLTGNSGRLGQNKLCEHWQTEGEDVIYGASIYGFGQYVVDDTTFTMRSYDAFDNNWQTSVVIHKSA